MDGQMDALVDSKGVGVGDTLRGKNEYYWMPFTFSPLPFKQPESISGGMGDFCDSYVHALWMFLVSWGCLTLPLITMSMILLQIKHTAFMLLTKRMKTLFRSILLKMSFFGPEQF